MGYSATLKGKTVTAAEAYDSLIDSINNVYSDVVINNNNNAGGIINKDLHPIEYELFNNDFHVVDGPCYAFLVHGKGPAVGGQGFILDNDDTTSSSNIVIRNNSINNRLNLSWRKLQVEKD